MGKTSSSIGGVPIITELFCPSSCCSMLFQDLQTLKDPKPADICVLCTSFGSFLDYLGIALKAFRLLLYVVAASPYYCPSKRSDYCSRWKYVQEIWWVQQKNVLCSLFACLFTYLFDLCNHPSPNSNSRHWEETPALFSSMSSVQLCILMIFFFTVVSHPEPWICGRQMYKLNK